MQHLDARNPLVIDTRELRRTPGAMVEIERAAEAPEDLGTEVIAVRAGEPVELDLRLESVVEGVLVSGQVRASATGACVRCLEPASVPVDAWVQELFAYADRAAHHQEVLGDEDDDVRVLESDLLDLVPVIRDAVVPALPFQPLCSEDCPGLCSECGVPLRDDPDHAHETFDPRWAALQGLAAPAHDEKES